MMPSQLSWFEEVKQRLRIEQVARDLGLPVNTGERDWRGPCPSCGKGESGTRFQVIPSKQFYHCKACGICGDVIALAILLRGDKEDAYEWLADRAGVPRLRKMSPAERERHETKRLEEQRVRRVYRVAVEHWHRTMPPEVRQLLRTNWGLTDATIDEWLIGYAEGSLGDLRQAFEQANVPWDEVIAAGLYRPSEARGWYLHFTRRIIFPYISRDEVVYLIGRQVDPHITGPGFPEGLLTYEPGSEWEKRGGKYKKLPVHDETANPDISVGVSNEHLFGDPPEPGDSILFTEGITDCLAALQAGFACVSPVTVRFAKHDWSKLLAIAQRYEKVYICNDSERSAAGTRGAMATARFLHQQGIQVRLAELPLPEGVEKVDLCEYLKAHSPEDLRELLGSARLYLQCLIEAIPTDTPKTELAEPLRPVLAEIARCSPVERDGWLELICKRHEVRQSSARQMLREASRTRPPAPGGEQPASVESGSHRVIKGAVFEDRDHHYYVLSRDGTVEVISSFHVEPTERIQLDGGEVIVGDVTTDRGRVYKGVRFPPSAWHSKRSFIQSFPNADMQWTGTDDNVQGVLRILSRREVPVRQGRSVIGYVEHTGEPCWLTPEGLIGSGGLVTGSDLVLVEHDHGLATALRYPMADHATCRAVAAQVLPLLPALNAPAIVLPVMGWFFATPFKPRIMRILKRFPILWIWGTQGSGKTSLVKEVFWRLVGVEPKEKLDAFSVTTTKFALVRLLASTNSVPIFLDEYRPGDMSVRELNTIHRLGRSIYGGEVERRGRANLEVVSYHLSAPICIGGEARTSDAALVDRLVSVTPDPNVLVGTPAYQDAFHRLQRLDLAQLAVPYIRFALGRDTAADIEVATGITDEVLASIPGGTKVSIRCRDNLRVVVLGLTMYEAFAGAMGVRDLPELNIEAALSASIADLMDGERGAKSPLDQFVETCSVLAYNGTLVENRNWAVVGGLTCLHFPSCWEVYLEHQRRVGQPVDASAKRAIWRMIHESYSRGGYVKDVGKTVALEHHRLRTIALDLQQTGDFLDADGFFAGTNRGWGGPRDAAGNRQEHG